MGRLRLKIECAGRMICEALAAVCDAVAGDESAPGEEARISVEPYGPVEGLTERQVEVLRLLAHGLGNKEIASALGRSVKTVEFHRARIMERLGLHSAVELARFAFEHGLLQSDKQHPGMENPGLAARGASFLVGFS